MDSNTHSTGPPEGLAALTAAVEELATQDLDSLTDAARAERILALRWLLDRLEGQWLQELAGVDARGAAGAEHDGPGVDRRGAVAGPRHGLNGRHPGVPRPPHCGSRTRAGGGGPASGPTPAA